MKPPGPVVTVRVEACVVKGASDAGVYVGQSRTILVKDNEVFGNVAGIEIENSVDAEVVGNHVHDNVGGVLVFALPELPMAEAERSRRRAAEGTLGEAGVHQGQADPHLTGSDELHIEHRVVGAAQGPLVADLAANVAVRGGRPVNRHGGDQGGVGDLVGREVGVPLLEAVVGDAVGGGVEQSRAERADRCAAAGGVAGGRGGCGLRALGGGVGPGAKRDGPATDRCAPPRQ